MPRVTYISHDGKQTVLDVPVGTSVMQAAVLNGIDGIVAEPPGGAQNNHDEAARLLADALAESLESLEDTPGEELRRRRRAKFRGMGVFA